MSETRGKPPDRWLALESPSSGDCSGCRTDSVGVKLPSRTLATRDLMCRTSHRTRIQLERLTGIHERHVVGPGENSFTFAAGAARDCLAYSRRRASDIEMLINTSISRSRPVFAVVRAPAQPVRQAGDRPFTGGELRYMRK